MILFGAGEDEAIEMLNGRSMVTTVGSYRTAYARGSLDCGTVAGGFPTAQLRFRGRLKDYLDAQPAGNKDFWIGKRWRGSGGFISGIDAFFYLYDSTDKPFLRVKGNGPGTMRLGHSADGVAWTDYPASEITQSTLVQHSFRVKVHATQGRIYWYIDNALWFATPTFDTTVLCVGSPGMLRWGCPNSNGVSNLSEVMMTSADDPVPGLNLVTLPASLDGLLSQWAGGAVSINELVKDTGTVLSTGVADLDSTFVPPAIPALGAGVVIRAIIVSGEFATAAGAPQNVAGLINVNGTLYPAALQLVQNVAQLLQFIWDESPDTTDPFTESEVDPGNGFEFGVRSAA